MQIATLQEKLESLLDSYGGVPVHIDNSALFPHKFRPYRNTDELAITGTLRPDHGRMRLGQFIRCLRLAVDLYGEQFDGSYEDFRRGVLYYGDDDGGAGEYVKNVWYGVVEEAVVLDLGFDTRHSL